MDDRLPRHALLLLLTACLLGWPRAGLADSEGAIASVGGRASLGLLHLSNAGLGSRNPGQESLTINYEWGLSR